MHGDCQIYLHGNMGMYIILQIIVNIVAKPNVKMKKVKDADEFEKKIKDFFAKKLPSVVEEAYKVAIERDIKKVGKQLKEIKR